jgi:hypothetical protein
MFNLRRFLEIGFTSKLKEEKTIIFSLIEKVDHAIKMAKTKIQGEVFLYLFAIFFNLDLLISIKIIHKFVSYV